MSKIGRREPLIVEGCTSYLLISKILQAMHFELKRNNKIVDEALQCVE
jgi:hypothetical protein